jgi:PAP2 superfamily
VPLIELHWQQAAVLAVLSAVAAVALRLALARRRARPVARSRRWASVLASALALTRVAGAFERAHWLLAAEHRLGLPSELTVQQVVLDHPAVIRFINTFYLYAHINSIVVFLVWMFWRHRDRYRWARNTLVLTTGACLLVQMVPVAPPRMLTDYGFVDLALQYGQSVYGAFGSGVADQLSALPSVHVAWALLVAFFVLEVSTSRWRWLVLMHPAATIFVVVATANHYWADGIAAGFLLALALPVTDALERRRARAGTAQAQPPLHDPSPTPETTELTWPGASR